MLRTSISGELTVGNTHEQHKRDTLHRFGCTRGYAHRAIRLRKQATHVSAMAPPSQLSRAATAGAAAPLLEPAEADTLAYGHTVLIEFDKALVPTRLREIEAACRAVAAGACTILDVAASACVFHESKSGEGGAARFLIRLPHCRRDDDSFSCRADSLARHHLARAIFAETVLAVDGAEGCEARKHRVSDTRSASALRQHAAVPYDTADAARELANAQSQEIWVHCGRTKERRRRL